MILHHWIGAAAAAALILCTPAGAQPLNIPFAPSEDPKLVDPDSPAKKFRVDFARVEHEFPLSPTDLMKLTPENIAELSQEQVDQIYARLTAGPIPDGMYRGTLFFAQGDKLTTRLEEILGGVPGRIADTALRVIEQVGDRVWKGKVFERNNGLLRNMIDNHPLLLPLVTDVATVPRTEVPRGGLLGLSDTVWLLFPAKVYCGQSLLDGRRESIIVDYAYGDELPRYRASPDSIAGRGGLKIRDEIRMVRPGFYLGRAYVNKIFLLNFTLLSPEEASRQGPAFAAGGAVSEDCWTGEQVRRTAGQ